MNGAQALVQSLQQCGVELCLANPGTSEMHLVEGLDKTPRMRSVLTLFEGVCTGAADGYGRMAGKPAATLLHLGPGLANGIANLHNARKANTPIINLVGNHPAWHIGYDAPLTSDIDSLARNFSAWIKSSSTADTLAADAADAWRAAMRATPDSRGRISTLVIGADAAWGQSPPPPAPPSTPRRATVSDDAITSAASALGSGEPTVMILEHDGMSPDAVEHAARIASHTGCRLMTSTFPARVESGAGTPQLERMPYFPEHILASLDGVHHLVLIGGRAPASFFAYRDTPSHLVPDGCATHTLARTEEDAVDALARLSDRLGATQAPIQRFPKKPLDMPDAATTLNPKTMTAAISATLPEQAIIATDSGAGNGMFTHLQTANPHTWLSLTGGSIGQGGPAATGAALACPNRPVLALLGDGGAAYTIQCLWTQAREQLNVTTVIFANRKYNILSVEYGRLGVTEVGDIAASLFDIGNPEIDWTAMATSMGVPSARAETVGELARLLQQGMSGPGPLLIEARC